MAYQVIIYQDNWLHLREVRSFNNVEEANHFAETVVDMACIVVEGSFEALESGHGAPPVGVFWRGRALPISLDLPDTSTLIEPAEDLNQLATDIKTDIVQITELRRNLTRDTGDLNEIQNKVVYMRGLVEGLRRGLDRVEKMIASEEDK